MSEKRGRCIIVGAGDFFGMPFQPAEEDYVIAADAGYENLKAEGIIPDLVVGDFDSMEVEGVKGVTGPVKDLDIFADAEKAVACTVSFLVSSPLPRIFTP